MRQSWQTVSRVVGSLALLLCLAQPSQAQLAVVDASTLTQLVMQLKQQVESYRQLYEQTQQQLHMVWQGGQNLLKLDFTNLQDLLALEQQLNGYLRQAQALTYRPEQVWSQAQALYPKVAGLLGAADQRALEQQWAGARRDSARIALLTQAIQTSQAQRQQEWQQVLARAQQARGQLQAQQAQVEAQGLLGNQLMGIEQQLATQAREHSQRSFEDATLQEATSNALREASGGINISGQAAGRFLTLSPGR
jgi:P-type conjugative transfer protein TrbJ